MPKASAAPRAATRRTRPGSRRTPADTYRSRMAPASRAPRGATQTPTSADAAARPPPATTRRSQRLVVRHGYRERGIHGLARILAREKRDELVDEAAQEDAPAKRKARRRSCKEMTCVEQLEADVLRSVVCHPRRDAHAH